MVVGNTGWRCERGVDLDSHLPVCAHRMDDTDQQLQSDHKNPMAGHGDTPVHLVVVNDEQLKRKMEEESKDNEREKKNMIHGWWRSKQVKMQWHFKVYVLINVWKSS